jgi:CheY-specific phosphatase CheX
MNDTLLLTVAEKVITGVLQDAAFLFAEKLALCEKPDFSKWKPSGAVIEYTGQANGKIRLWADESLSRIIAENMLGMEYDSNLEKEKSTDALNEILNMVTGNFITAYHGENSAVNMGLPSLSDISLLKHDYENEKSLWFNVEGHFMLLTIESDS